MPRNYSKLFFEIFTRGREEDEEEKLLIEPIQIFNFFNIKGRK